MKMSIDRLFSSVLWLSPFTMLIIDHGLRTMFMLKKFVECEKLGDIVKKGKLQFNDIRIWSGKN